ncbi:MAG: hypothetical protein HZB59_00665 [Ignavibacteriales bacterium]|nr:hypothetical protein [Ignavibacteriales bacterium]
MTTSICAVVLSTLLIISCREFDSEVRINTTDQPGIFELKSLNNHLHAEIFSIAQLTPTALIAGSDSGNIFKISASSGMIELYSSYGESYNIVSLHVGDSLNIVLLNSNSDIGKSTDGGLTWHPWSENLDGKIIITLYYQVSTNRFYIGSSDGSIYHRSFADTIWYPITNLHRSVTSFTSSDSTNLFAGTWSSGIFKINLQTNQIEGINSGLLNPYIKTLHTCKNNKIFAGTYGDGIFYSSNNGIFWFNYSKILDTAIINNLDATSNYDLIATTNSALYIIKNNSSSHSIGIFDSTNILINTLIVDINDRIYIGTNDGIYRADPK